MPVLHVDPAALRAAAASVEALLPALHVPGMDPADLAALVRSPGGAALVAEHDRLTTALTRTGRDLAELAAGLCVVAAGVEVADHDAVRAVREVDR